MLVRDMANICLGNVTVYTSGDDLISFKDLYKGKLCDAPSGILKLKIMCIGAHEDNVEIAVWNS